MSGPARFALYWAPTLEDPLHALGSRWLGRDAETGAALPQPDLPGMAELTAEARRYGLHATLKAPFRLARPYAEFRAAAAALARRTRPFLLPPLRVDELDGFLALRESAPCPPLQALADACVIELDPFRAPLSEEELARRRRSPLSPRQEAYLERWGYPYVLDQWRFHVTLSRRLGAAERALLRPAAEALLGEAAARPRLVCELCLFSEAAPGAPFLIAERLPLGG
ncbi:MAG: DUF1045 domain-containing protein [Rhodovarius sp.]|nr:DUF1045 domain-containing protein [Rhodovarius sp.]MCX7932521.1 DUF1045 domain-containing protein [Rhodovarius sp.]MDW8314092.1 DUF1045 domain-containing protein [Rhodovarius sp.]